VTKLKNKINTTTYLRVSAVFRLIC
jgi:Ras-related protein Rab-11A